MRLASVMAGNLLLRYDASAPLRSPAGSRSALTRYDGEPEYAAQQRTNAMRGLVAALFFDALQDSE